MCFQKIGNSRYWKSGIIIGLNKYVQFLDFSYRLLLEINPFLLTFLVSSTQRAVTITLNVVYNKTYMTVKGGLIYHFYHKMIYSIFILLHNIL